MFIDGIGISSYRSFGDDLQFVGPCKQINILIGQNNSGKSNILRFLKDHYRTVETEMRGSKKLARTELDRHIGTTTSVLRVAFGLNPEGSNYKAILEKVGLRANADPDVVRLIDRLLHFEELTRANGLVWFVYESRNSEAFSLSQDESKRLAQNKLRTRHGKGEGLTGEEWSTLIRVILGRGYNNISAETLERELPTVLNALSPAQSTLPEIALIDAIRAVRQDDSLKDHHDYSGLNIVERLGRLERPKAGPGHDQAKAQFARIERFVAEVIGSPDIRLEVPADRNTIHVIQDDRPLPLENLGTGIHEVVILAIAATLLQNQIVCIEEPEIHLHPILQRKLIRYLQQTNNQYFIATHSAALIDAPDIGIFHVRHNGQHSVVERVVTPTKRFEVVTDLGYLASDLLQTNCIFWVEGPSDRLYLRHWITTYDRDLIEGIHYSIMFYGGRLLCHLSADDEEVTDFIALRHINRNLAIIIDSDRDQEGKRINKTKVRVRREFDRGPGFAWITAGREIENYIAPDVLLALLKESHPDADRLAADGRYDHIYYYLRRGSTKLFEADKVKLARSISAIPANLDVLDLREQVRKAAEFIRACNNL